jgi:hypothetical protein
MDQAPNLGLVGKDLSPARSVLEPIELLQPWQV